MQQYLARYVWLLAVTQIALADFILKFDLLSFDNNQGRVHNGIKCDMHDNSHCDTTFKLCIAWPGKPTCFLNGITPVFYNTNSIDPSLFERHNSTFTFKLSATKLPESLHIRVYVFDHDGVDKQQSIENFTAKMTNYSGGEIPVSLRTGKYFVMHPVTKNSVKSLSVRVRVTCDAHFYGGSCQYSCGQFESEHYCDKNGTAVCRNNYTIITCVNRTTWTRTFTSEERTTRTQEIGLGKLIANHFVETGETNTYDFWNLPPWVFIVSATSFLCIVAFLVSVILFMKFVRRDQSQSQSFGAQSHSRVKPELLREWSQVSATFRNNTYVDNPVDLMDRVQRAAIQEQEYESIKETESVYEKINEDDLKADAQSNASQSEKSAVYRVPLALPIDVAPDVVVHSHLSVQLHQLS